MESNNNPELIKLCPACGAKNKSVYAYCNECGAPLGNQLGGSHHFSQPVQTAGFVASNPSAPNFTPQVSAYSVPPAPPQTPSSDPTMAPQDIFDGIPPADLYAYTGSDNKLYAKLFELRRRQGQTLWCLPLFLLGLFFGSFGMACWHLYHRLYKRAAALFALTAVGWALGCIMGYQMLNGVFETMLEWFKSGLLVSDDPAMGLKFTMDLYREMFGTVPVYCYALSGLFSVVDWVLIIALPFYSYQAYYRTAVKRIRGAKTTSAPALAKLGGPNLAITVTVAVIAFLLYCGIIAAILIPFFQDTISLAMSISQSALY